MANQDAALLKQALAAYKANPGGAAGGDCYYWVNQQLKKASSNKVSLPGLAKDAKGGYTGTLKSNPHFQKTGETFADAKPGQIIEMVSKAKNGTIYPHTAVIVGVNKKGLVVIDSNWHLNDHLDSHIIPATTFTSPTTRGHYTIYDAKW
jgi:hypothetical protein